MAAQVHSYHGFLIVKQRNQRPCLAFRNRRWRYFSHLQVDKQSVYIVMKLGLVLVAEFDYFFQGINMLTRNQKEKLRPVKIRKTVETTSISNAFQRFFVHRSLVYSFYHIKDGGKRAALISFFNDVFDSRFSYAFHTAEPKPDLSFFIYRKSFLGFIDVRPQYG